MLTLNPGDVIGVRVGPVTHVGIVSDRYVGGEPLVISNSHRAGGVAEEPLSVFRGGYQLVSVPQSSTIARWQIPARARQMLGSRWNLFSWNCEHFVHWASGLKPRSPQLDQASAFVGIALLIRALAMK